MRAVVPALSMIALAACQGPARSGSPDGAPAPGDDAGGGSATPDAGEPGGPDSGAPVGIDFSIWSLQLPTGSGTSPTTISPSALAAGYTDAYFYVAADGGHAFMDPQTGITTSGSKHCRTEMRENNSGGGQAAWASTGVNTMTVTGKVVQVGGGAGGHVTIGQLFNGTDSIPLCELEYSTSRGGFELLYEEAKGAGTTIDLKTPIALGSEYTFTLALSAGVLTVDVDGQVVYTHTPSAAIAAKRFYFKFGDYDQTATAGAISDVPYTIVEASGARVVHQ
jgi:Alginate lyase